MPLLQMNAFLHLLADKGWIPHEGQREYLQNPSLFRVLACGRRWGKTDAAAADMAGRIVSERATRQLAIAPTLAQAKLVFDRVKWMLAAAGIVFVPTMTPHPSIKIFDEGGKKSGSVIHVLDARSGHEAKNLRGEGADHVLLDEAAFMPESLITEVAMPMLAANDGRMTLISTPRGRNFFYRFFALGQRGESGFWSRRSPSSENPRVSAGYLTLQREILTESAYRTEYEAEFLDAQTAVFGNESIDDALDGHRVDAGAIAIGVDWARHHDYTAVVIVRGTRRRCEVVRCYRWGAMRWREQLDRVCDLVEDMPDAAVVCDVTGAGDPVTEELHDLLPETRIIDFRFTQSSKAEIIDRLVWLMERRAIRIPSDADLIRELEHFEAEPHAVGGPRYSAASGFNDDLVCALAMACSALPWNDNVTILTKERR